MNPEDRIRIQHMLDAAQKAVEFVGNLGFSDFIKDEKLTLSAIRLLEITGEAAIRISDDFKEEYSEVPWYQIAGTRNRLVHGYFDVDLTIIYQIITQDLPPLIAQLQSLLKR
jgi:uncharacterized protein with HEPN domain